MRSISVGLCAVLVALGAFAVNANPLGEDQLLGAKRCTWGPSYWCSNLTNAKDCKAVSHCIQTVWEKQAVPVDNDSICQICKDMVTQARDQLRSNETMEELREVFEGSCNLIPIKIVKKECSKLADDFIPELVEALSSQMNPDQVCSVAGLCNNAEIDKLLMTYYAGALDGTLTEESSSEEVDKPKQVVPATSAPSNGQLSCGKCNGVAKLISNKFQASNRDEVLENILHLCGEMSSFSDACANIVLTYFNDIYSHLKQNLDADGICHMSGVCAGKYHRHAEDPKEEEITDLSSVEGDDIPCELCEQLMKHMRDVLVANTTEAEFKEMLKGICKQTKGFKEECLSIVDQYYDVIYHTLVHNLDANGACFLIGVCPKGSVSTFEGEIRPLLPVFPPAAIKITVRRKLGAHEPKFTQEDMKQMALPIDHLMGAANPSLLVDGGEKCTICEYLLHFVQEELATPRNEESIKHVVNEICEKMPKGVQGECHNFVDMYGDAVIALLIQGLDPREICPKIQMCPANKENHDDMEVFAPLSIEDSEIESDKPTCPLCLFAVEQAQQKIRDNKSKANIKDVLDHLCVHLPNKLQGECVDFVETYSSELIDMLITDFKPQEICVAIKLCPKANTYLSDLGISVEDDSSSEEDTAFNEIDGDDKPIEIVFENDGNTPNCLLCEEIIKHAEKRVSKHTTKADIEKALQRSCDKLRKNLQPKCKTYVEKHGDKIATLILKEMEPKIICRELGLCIWSEQEDLDIDEAFKYDVIAMPNTKLAPSERFTRLDTTIQDPPNCVLCEFIMTKLESELKNKTTQDEIKHAIESICNRMPNTVRHSCDKFVDQYATAILTLIGTVPPKEVCQKMMLCYAGLDAIITDEVIECGVCHGAATSLLPFFKEHVEPASLSANSMIGVACENLPAKYYQICTEMVKIYGQSILHLSQMPNVDESRICAEIGKCFEDEKSGLAFARISA